MLHGDIKVDGRVIGAWQAVQSGQVDGVLYRYDCLVYVNGREREFQVVHDVRQAMTTLAAKVLSHR